VGHLGFTPQSLNQLGGYKVQGKTQEAAQLILKQAKELEKAGAFSVVLEMVPEDCAKIVTENLTIPTIGIGAGRYCS
jgi:3-methyl-2-oxobutanoate hydroxymethyltransferase